VSRHRRSLRTASPKSLCRDATTNVISFPALYKGSRARARLFAYCLRYAASRNRGKKKPRSCDHGSWRSSRRWHARINSARPICRPHYPDVASAGHAKAAVRHSADHRKNVWFLRSAWLPDRQPLARPWIV